MGYSKVAAKSDGEQDNEVIQSTGEYLGLTSPVKGSGRRQIVFARSVVGRRISVLWDDNARLSLLIVNVQLLR